MCLDQIGRNIKAYIDDMVVKSKTADSLIANLEETFTNLKRYRWKLNPSKCIFRVPSGILLGYIISARGIEPNPDKVSIITNMKRPIANLSKGYTKAHRVSGCSQSLYTTPRQKEATVLHTTQGLRALLLVRGG